VQTRHIRRRRWQTSPVTGESTKETVKTIAQGMPGDPGVTVVTMLVCFFHIAREAAGAAGARHSLRPLMFRWADVQGKTRVDARRDREAVSAIDGCCLKTETLAIIECERSHSQLSSSA
jgi:hypothetical protein